MRSTFLSPAVALLPDALDPENLERETKLAAAVEALARSTDLTEEEVAERFLKVRPGVNSDEAAIRLIRFHREAEIAHGDTERPAPKAEVVAPGVLRVEATGPGSPLAPEDVERPVSYEPTPEIMSMVREGAMRYHLDSLRTLEAETPQGFGLPLAFSEPEEKAKAEARALDRSKGIGALGFVARSEGPNRRQRRAAKKR